MIYLNNVSKKFGDKIVLEKINLTLEKGKIYGFVGRNGTGKTVLFKLICGFMLPSSGKIRVNNMEIGKDIDFPTSCGIIIESPDFIGNLTGYKNLKMLADIKGKISDDEIKRYLRMYGLDPEDKKKVKKYSLGMKQKLGLIQAFMEDPDILILDEPMNSLDEESVIKVRSFLKEIKNRKLILLASHNKEDIELLCDVIFEIKNGSVDKLESMKGFA